MASTRHADRQMDMAGEVETLRGTIMRAGRRLPEEELLRLADDIYAMVRARRRDHEMAGEQPAGTSRWAASQSPEGGSFWALRSIDRPARR